MIIEHSQNYKFPIPATELLKQWYAAKYPFIKSWGNKTIIRSQFPITLPLTTHARQNEFNDFLAAVESYGALTLEFENFLRTNEDSFFDNRTIENRKLTKVFKSYLPQSKLKAIQDLASTYIQKNKITGYLYLSCNPLDYLTMSENAYNWHTCQSLDGTYRAATLSYMVDPSTLVAYIADGQFYHYPSLPANYKWNSKKVRCLVHVGPKGQLYGRTYPFPALNFVDEIRKQFFPQSTHFFPLVERFCPTDKTAQCHLNNRYYPPNEIFDFTDLIGYNDIENTGATLWASSIEENNGYVRQWLREHFHVKIGEQPICPCCGFDCVTANDKLICNHCAEHYGVEEEQFLYCDSCGHRIYDETKAIEKEGYYFHSSCLRKENI